MIEYSELPLPSAQAREEALARQLQLTKPAGSLGRLEEVAVELASWLGEAIPCVRPAAALIFASDHAVSALGVSAFPREVTRAMVQNFLGGGAAASVLARYHRMPLVVVDVGVEGGPVDTESSNYFRASVADAASGDLVQSDGMTEATLTAAMRAGHDAVNRLASDTRLVLLGEMGIGNTTLASAIAAALLSGDPGDWVGNGTGVTAAALGAKRELVRAAVARVGTVTDPIVALRRLGGREIAAMVGAMLEAAHQRRAILVDGFIVSVAALVAVKLEPRVRSAMLFAHRSAERAHARVLDALQARPLLELEMRLGEGSGALVAYALLDMACHLHAEMATFAGAGVPDRCA